MWNKDEIDKIAIIRLLDKKPNQSLDEISESLDESREKIRQNIHWLLKNQLIFYEKEENIKKYSNLLLSELAIKSENEDNLIKKLLIKPIITDTIGKKTVYDKVFCTESTESNHFLYRGRGQNW